MTKVERTCPRCGLVFVSDKLDGMCPSCLLSNTLDIEDRGGERAFWEDEPVASAPGRGFSHFELIEELGRGGMGTVYRARDHVTDRIVALKVLQAHHLNEPDLVQRFRSEVRAVTSLDHRHILPIHEVGEHDGIPFFSMKLATGGSLAQRLPEFLRHPRKAAQLVAKIARGVQHAHERGILHRDLKPGNILLDDAGEPYVCDFGLAKWINDDRRLTITSAVLGTPHYIAPEQANGKAILTIAADIYSLGAVLYELLTGRPPFVGETVMDTLRQASECTPAKPSSIVNQTPRDLETVCLKALEREPAARYKTASALADDLENWLSGRPIRARPVSAAEQLWRWARRNPLPAALGVILALAITTLAVGATIAAVKIDRSRNRAVAAEKDATEQLYGALLAQARASRMTSQAGHRIEALEAIKKAAAIRPSLELRNEAIAALTLVDLKVAKTLKVRENNGQRLAFDSKLETVAVATKQGDIDIIRLDDGMSQKRITGSGHLILSLIHSGTRYVAARGNDEAVYIYECASGRLLFQFPGRKIPRQMGFACTNCAFSSDETLLALGSTEGIEIIEMSTGKEIARLKTTQPEQCSFSPDGKYLAFGSLKEKSVNIWKIADQASVTKVDIPAGATSLAWNSDGQALAVGCEDYAIRVFRTNDWKINATLEGHRQPVWKTAFNHRGDMLVSSSDDSTLRLWDLRNMSQLVELTGYKSESSIEFSPDDRTISTTDYKTSAVVLEVLGLNRVCTAFASPASQEQIQHASSIDFSPDSRLLAKASITSVQIFDAKHTRLLQTIPFSIPTQTSLRFLADSQTLLVLSRRTGTTLHRFSFQDGNFRLISSDNQAQWPSYAFGSAPYDRSPIFCLTSDKEAKSIISDFSSGLTLLVNDEPPTITDIAISPDKKWFITTYRGRLPKIRAFPSGQNITELAGGSNGSCVISPKGRWLALTGLGNYLLWNTDTWTKGPSLPPEVEEKTGNAAFSYDEQYLATMMQDEAALLSLPEGKLLALLDQRILPNLYRRLSFSPDGSQLALHGRDNSLILWELDELQSELHKLNLMW
ncbi:MAG: protein kinase [Verrucomicrobia bacterium]|nr:protein kinase [Verrucomicrobiota bacterium]